MPMKLEDIIDVQQFQMLQDRLNEIYSFPSAIIDNEGKVHTATAWQDVCTKFHRQHSECLKECIKSDQYIADHLHEANPTVSYRCPHGLIDNATPIIVEGVHYGNYFTGQFFLESPDLNFFRVQAKRYGFDEEAYIEAVKKVPIWTQAQLNSYLFFIKGLIEVITSTGLKNLKEIEARKKLDESEERASTILNQLQDGFWVTNIQGGQIIDVNEAMCRMLGYSRDEMLKMSVAEVEANDSAEEIERTIQHVIQAGSAHFESRFRRKDNTIIDVDVSITYLPKRNLFFGFHRDITARKQMENALRESEERHRVLLSESPDPIFSFTPEGQYKYANQAFANGVGKPADEIIGKSIWDVFSKDEAAKRFAALSQVFRSGEKRVIEVRVPRTDGDQHYITSISPIKDAAGKILSAICSSKDITEHKRAEEIIKKSEEKFSKAFEASPEAITIASMEDGRYIEVNNVFLKTTGFQRDEVIGHTSTELGVWVDPKERLKFIEELSINGSLKNFDTRYRMHNGEVRDFLVSSEVIEIDRKQCSLNFILDITERKQAEEALRESETKLQAIFDTVGTGILIIDRETQVILEANQTAIEMTGLSKDRIIGQICHSLVCPAQQGKCPVKDLGQSVDHSERKLLCSDGHPKDILKTVHPVIIKGRPCYLESFIDISDRLQAESALRESEERYRMIFDNSPLGIMHFDANGIIVGMNEKFAQIMGGTREKIRGFNMLEKLQDQAMLMAVRDALDDRLGYYEGDYVSITAGKTTPMRAIYQSITTNDGKFMGAVGLFEDIGERKLAEEAIRQSQKTAERLAEEMAIIGEIGRVAVSTLDINQAFELVDAEIHKLILYDRFLVNLKKNDNEFVVAYVSGTNNPKRKIGDSYDSRGTTTGVVMNTRTGILIQPDDAEEIKELYPNLYETFKTGLRSTMSVPLISMAEVIGSMTFRSKKLKAYTEQDLRLAERIGMQIAGAIANAQLFNDVSRTGEALRESEEKYRILFEGLNDAVLVHDLDEEGLTGRFLQVNDVACRRMGYTREELLSLTPRDITVPEEYERIANKRIALDSRGDILIETIHLTKDGLKIPVESNIHKFWYLGRQVALSISRDITERKRIKEESDRYSLQLSMLHDTSIVLTAELNLDALLHSIAQQALNLIGGESCNCFIYRPELDLIELVTTAGENLSNSGKMRRRCEGAVGQVWATGTPLLINDYHAWPGRKREYDHLPSRTLMLMPVHWGEEFLGVINMLAYTPHRYTEADMEMLRMFAAQAAIAIHNAQLYDRIKLELAERKRAEEENRSLEERLNRAEKMEALGQLAGGVAHDLNNVLGILSGYSELLRDEILEDNPARSYVDKILQSTKKGAAIIQDLLTLARRGVTVSDIINLNSIVFDFLETPVFDKFKNDHPHVTFRTEKDENLLNIKGSSVHLEKALMNLVSNAAEAITDPGEVTIRTENRHLDKPIRGYDEVKEGDYTVLVVSDTGMGIPAESIGKIFEPFYTKKKMGKSGTGLGLAIVWGTVKDHNGHIDLQTEEGKGTTFSLYFPVTQEDLVAPEAELPMEQYMGKGETVLVVDDRAEQRDIATRLLTKLGYQVHCVSSGEEAVEYLKTDKADILVLDMIMTPGIDGLETYRRILEISPKQKAIIVSGFSETDRTEEAQKLGAGAYVKKPYVLEKIGVAIRDELKR